MGKTSNISINHPIPCSWFFRLFFFVGTDFHNLFFVVLIATSYRSLTTFSRASSKMSACFFWKISIGLSRTA
jgi:hypothetical protein